MEDQLWALFRETGDPMGYLLYRAEKAKKTKDKAKSKAEQASADVPAEKPTASV